MAPPSPVEVRRHNIDRCSDAFHAEHSDGEAQTGEGKIRSLKKLEFLDEISGVWRYFFQTSFRERSPRRKWRNQAGFCPIWSRLVRFTHKRQSPEEMRIKSFIYDTFQMSPAHGEKSEEVEKTLLGKDENANGLTPQQSPVSHWFIGFILHFLFIILNILHFFNSFTLLQKIY